VTVRIDLKVLVAGGGVVGWSVALALARAGARVTVHDPAPLGDNASGVAAGMLAPVFESLFDGCPAHLALLRRARDLWPELATSIGLTLERSGAMAVGASEEMDVWAPGLAEAGASFSRLSPSQAVARAPWLAPGLGAIWTDEDWRLEPLPALAAFRAAGERAGVQVLAVPVTGYGGDGADALVVASGASRSLISLAPELSALVPIKGHILRAPDLKLTGPVARAAGGYVCPSPRGALVGATMETGRDDRAVDPDVVARLRALGASVAPGIAAARLTAAAAVRATTPDGLPLVGASQSPGVWLAAGARRNGWLLAPLIAEAIILSLRDGIVDPAFDARRFKPPAIGEPAAGS
jgi:glycine oxidase